MWPVRDFEGKLLEGWERGRSENGIPYYIYHSGEHTQWDHPILKLSFEEVLNCNSIKYVAYRTANKCRVLQKLTKLHTVKLPTIVSQFDQHGFRCNETENVMMSEQLENLLSDIYSTTMKDQASEINIRVLAEVAANIFMNIYDRVRTGIIRVSSAKIALILLCSARLQEKYKYLFRQFADHNNCISQNKLVELLKDIAYIPEYLSERPSFGSQLVEMTSRSCYKSDSYSLGVNEEAFMNWLLCEPQTLVWISTLYRMTSAETSVHELKCSICKIYPMTGLRYQCLRCFQFHLCQNCFFTGQSNKRHKLYHPLQEYCYRSTSKEGTKAFVATIKNMFSKKTAGNMKQRYLPISQSAPNNTELISPTTNANRGVDDEVSSKCASEDIIDNCETPLDSRTVYYESLQRNETNLNPKQQKELKEIILHLEEENRQLHAEVENFRNSVSRNAGSSEFPRGQSNPSYETNASMQLEWKLNRLRSLLINLQTVYSPNETEEFEQKTLPPRYESTPARSLPGQHVFNMDSPIDPRYECAISNIPSPQTTPQHALTHNQWDQRLGNLPVYARRSLPMTSFQRAYPPGSTAYQPSTSTQRSSARAILQTRGFSVNTNSSSSLCQPNDPPSSAGGGGSYQNNNVVTYYVKDYAAEDLNPNYCDISNGGQVDIMGENTSSGLCRIQTELESIIRQLEAIYPGCSSQQTIVSGNVSDKYRIMTAANEIETMLRDLVAKVTLTGADLTNSSAEHIPNA